MIEKKRNLFPFFFEHIKVVQLQSKSYLQTNLTFHYQTGFFFFVGKSFLLNDLYIQIINLKETKNIKIEGLKYIVNKQKKEQKIVSI